MNRVHRAVLGATGFLALLAGGWEVAGMAQAAGTEAEVRIEDFRFEPVGLTVAAGTKVTWVNRDFEPHTVVSVDDGKPFKSPGLDTHDKYSVVFDKPGAFKYFCSVHPRMAGTVTVK